MSSVSSIFQQSRESFRELRRIIEPAERMMVARVGAILNGIEGRIDRIESRTKKFTSIRDNYIKDYGIPENPPDINEFLRDASDLIGIRIVVYYTEDVNIVRNCLCEAYPNAIIDEKLTIYDINKGARFGYRAVHLNFELIDDHIFRGQPYSKAGVEIQIRTLLSDAWARHSHKLAYKGGGAAE